MSIPPLWGNVGWKKWSPFFDLAARSPIFGHLKMGTFDRNYPRSPLQLYKSFQEKRTMTDQTRLKSRGPNSRTCVLVGTSKMSKTGSF